MQLQTTEWIPAFAGMTELKAAASPLWKKKGAAE